MLLKKIDADLKAAMKEKDQARLTALRMLKTAIGNKAIELKVDALDDSKIISLIRQDVKRHLDSIEQFKKGSRVDLAAKEEAELKVLKSYLPKEASPDEIKEAVQKSIEETNAEGKKDFGKVMKLAMEKLKGGADGKAVSSMVNELLCGPIEESGK